MIEIFRTLGRYLTGGCEHLTVEPPADRANGRTIVLVHGVLYRSLIMREMLGNWLARQGFRVVVYDYRTTRDTVRGHGRSFRAWLETLDTPFALVTHSMGGLLARVALERPLPRVECLLQIAPPNRGSRSASFWCREIPGAGKLVRSLPDMRREQEGTTLTLPMVHGIPVGILAAEFDVQVDLDLAPLPEPVPFAICPAGHCSILKSAQARKLMLRFLDTGHFS